MIYQKCFLRAVKGGLRAGFVSTAVRCCVTQWVTQGTRRGIFLQLCSCPAACVWLGPRGSLYLRSALLFGLLDRRLQAVSPPMWFHHVRGWWNTGVSRWLQKLVKSHTHTKPTPQSPALMMVLTRPQDAPLQDMTCTTACTDHGTQTEFMVCAMISERVCQYFQRTSHFSVLGPQPDWDVEK